MKRKVETVKEQNRARETERNGQKDTDSLKNKWLKRKKKKKDKERGIETKIIKAETKREIETGRQRERNRPDSNREKPKEEQRGFLMQRWKIETNIKVRRADGTELKSALVCN